MKPAKRNILLGSRHRATSNSTARLRNAVEASSPEFSTDLHAQVMRELSRRARKTSPASPPPLRLYPWHIAALAAAAAVVVLVVALVMLMAGRDREQRIVKGPDAVRHVPPATTSASPLTPPSLSDAMAYVDPVKTRLERAPRAFFFHSADRLQHYCLNQLRIFPSRPQRNPAEEPASGSPSAG